jgi:ribonuclease G
MSKELCISSTPHETRLAIVEDDQLTEIYYERENEYTLAGSIYKGRVTRVLPGMQSAFVDIGLERDAFLYVTDFLEEQAEGEDFERPPVQNAGSSRERQPQDARGPRPPREGSYRDASRDGSARDASREPRREPADSVEPTSGSTEAGRDPGGDTAAKEGFDEGTRRWRGRRGRRRGGLRGAPREGVAAIPAADPSFSPDPEMDENFHDEPEAPFEAVAGFPISAQAAPSEDFLQDTFASTPAHARTARRDNRGETRNEGRREPRHDARHETRRESRPEGRQESIPAGGAIVLPGESLSKYGHKPAAAPAIFIESVDRSDEKPLPVITTSRPSTLVEGELAWDGVSSALPGESLSKHRNRPQTAAPAPQFSQPAAPQFSDFSAESIAPGAQEASAAAHEPDAEAGHAAPIEILHAVHTPQGEVSFEEVHSQTEPEAVASIEQPAPLILEEAESPIAPPQPEPDHEFEPEHASASYRVDPVAPSEFRLATAVEDAPEVQTPTVEYRTADFFQSQPTPVSDTADSTAAASNEESRWDWQESAHAPVMEEHPPVHEAPQAVEAPELEVHGTFQAESAPQTEPVSEVLSDDHVVAGSFTGHAEAAHAEESFFPESNPLELVHAFAPGSGLLEEEVIDEEEYDFSPLNAHSEDHDLEEIEEETLDSGSQLGDLIRDEHLKRRVSGEPEADEEESEDGEDEFGEDALSEEEFAEEGLAEEELTDPEFAETSTARMSNPESLSGQLPNRFEQPEAGIMPAPRRDDHRRRDGGRGNRRNNGQRGRNGGGHRHSAQTADLPIISDLLKQGQEVLVQIAKEPIAKKGARITSHIALPGRFLVFMPTVNHVGVSRKIDSDEERHRLKRILTSEKGTAPGGFIVRTAAEGASEEELRADLRFLISLWTEIKTRSDNGKSPALIYHDLNLVERVLRDQVSDNFSTIWVDSETEYERIVRFLNRFEPSLVRRVKLYTKETPLFEQFGIQEEISKALRSKVWLKSGGSIVINQTEALVAIDINTGKYVGKTARLEDTIVKTNLDAIPEIVRQIRLRDLGGIIIIDFIDMDERKNRNRVMQALEDELKNDRAPSKVLQFNDFGLVAITRKRVKQSLERTLSTQCNICAGTGMVKSPVTVCNEIYTEMRKMMKTFERGDVLLRVHPEIVKTLKAANGKWLTELEEMIGRTILVKSDPALHPEQFDIH